MSEPALLSPARPTAAGTAVRGSALRLRALAVAATATTFALIGIGALVRATGSGLGCSGWPKCTATSWLPPMEFHALVEYSHRLTAFVDVLLVVALAVVAARGFRDNRRVVRPAVASVLLVLVQAGLGGIVVHGELEALLVTAHLVTAVLFAGALVVTTVAAFSLDARPSRSWPSAARSSVLAAGAVLLVIAVGAYVRGEGAGLVFDDWPLMDGRLVPATWSVPVAVHFTHRVLALLVFAGVVVFAVRLRRAAPDTPTASLASVAAGLLAAQVVIGGANVWSDLASAAVVAHVTVAALAWGALVATVATARLLPVRPDDGTTRVGAP